MRDQLDYVLSVGISSEDKGAEATKDVGHLPLAEARYLDKIFFTFDKPAYALRGDFGEMLRETN